MQAVLDALPKLQLTLSSSQAQQASSQLLNLPDLFFDRETDMDPRVAGAIRTLWQDRSIREAVRRRNEFRALCVL